MHNSIFSSAGHPQHQNKTDERLVAAHVRAAGDRNAIMAPLWNSYSGYTHYSRKLSCIRIDDGFIISQTEVWVKYNSCVKTE